MENRSRSARFLEWEAPSWLKIAAPALHALVFVFVPLAGVLLLLGSMQEIDPGPVPDNVKEFGAILLCVGSVAALASGISLVRALWAKRAWLARSYCVAWILLFFPFFLLIFTFLLLSAGAHTPPSGAVLLAGLMILPAPVALIWSTTFAIVPGGLLALFTRLRAA